MRVLAVIAIGTDERWWIQIPSPICVYSRASAAIFVGCWAEDRKVQLKSNYALGCIAQLWQLRASPKLAHQNHKLFQRLPVSRGRQPQTITLSSRQGVGSLFHQRGPSSHVPEPWI